MREFSIDEEFRARIPKLSTEERVQLESSLLFDGCRDRLLVWDEGGILLDGHNRYAICRDHNIDFGIDFVSLPDRESALDWIDRNQLSRRNLTPDDFKIISGRIYNRRKKQGSRTDLTYPQLEDKSKTSEVVAAELGTSKATIERNGQRAELHDALLDTDEEAAEIVKSLPQAEVAKAAKAAKVAKSNPEAAAVEVKRAHVAHASGEMEWYTPVEYLEAARKVMGGIDTDPASSEVAQQNVKAEEFFTALEDGLIQDWHGCVWLNPPYGKALIEQFASKFVEQYYNGNIDQAIVLVNNATDTGWFATLCESAAAVCFPRGRIKFLDANNVPANTPLQGQAFLYFGEQCDEFVAIFGAFGRVWRSA